jgi:hypothetical protein
MREAGIGRVLVASLHQGISDVLPMRLAFYENWLNAEGLREGTIGLAPLSAVLSFLRQEGEAYQTITRRAGDYAAEWTVESLSPMQRTILRRSPPWLRTRLLLRLFRRLVRNTYQESAAVVRLRGRTASVQLRGSTLCVVREPVPKPLCGFYAAACARLLTLFDVPAQVDVISCRATGDGGCSMTVALGDPAGEA